MFLDHLCCVVGKLLYVRITPAACFLLELCQVFFVILEHHVHVRLIRTPAALRLFFRQFEVLFCRDFFQFIIRLL